MVLEERPEPRKEPISTQKWVERLKSQSQSPLWSPEAQKAFAELATYVENDPETA